MPTQPSRTIIGDRYELSAPIIPSDGEPFRVLVDPITTQTFSQFLNELGHVESKKGPILINTVNYDYPLSFAGGVWHPREGRVHRPMTLMTFWAAWLFAEWVGMRLMNRAEWEAAVALDRPHLRELSSAALNIEDVAHGPIDVDQTRTGASGIRGLLGNVGFWGYKTSAGFAWSFGVGWNKSRLLLDGPGVRQRWIHATSVSTGLRLVEPCRCR
jgi:hypothetical protein